MLIRANERGFTLNEILVVIGIISILAAIAVPAYQSYKEQAKTAQVMEELKRIETALIALGSDTLKWPGPAPIGKEGNTEILDLNSAAAGLVTFTNAADFPNWNGPYVTSVPQDPWGTNYFFDPDYDIPGGPSQVPVIGSFGPNKVGKNLYDSDDVLLRLPCKRSDCQ